MKMSECTAPTHGHCDHDLDDAMGEYVLRSYVEVLTKELLQLEHVRTLLKARVIKRLEYLA